VKTFQKSKKNKKLIDGVTKVIEDVSKDTSTQN